MRTKDQTTSQNPPVLYVRVEVAKGGKEMKVEKRAYPIKFTPFTVTIETEEEAKMLWHRFNCNRDIETYEVDYGTKLRGNLSQAMWNEIDKVYNPEKVR